MKCGISNFRKAIVKFRGMLGGGFMIGKMEGDTISDRSIGQIYSNGEENGGKKIKTPNEVKIVC